MPHAMASSFREPADPADGNEVQNKDGYTNLEAYLNSLTQ